MRVIQWIVFAYLSILVQSMYRFRFHTCRKEDQEILDRENLITLRQVVFIDDGSHVPGKKARRLAEQGIEIHHGSAMKNLTKNYQAGAESVLRIIRFKGSNYFIVINFFHRSYYFMKRGDEWRMSPLNDTIKPSFSHFVRVYFICAPGNARSALILFGEQAKLRVLRPKKHGEPLPRPQKRTIREVKEVKFGDETVRLCRKIKKRPKRTIKHGPPRYPMNKDNRRLRQRMLLFKKVALVMAHYGFGVVIALNSVILFVLFCIYKKRGGQKKNGSDKDGDNRESLKKAKSEEKNRKT